MWDRLIKQLIKDHIDEFFKENKKNEKTNRILCDELIGRIDSFWNNIYTEAIDIEDWREKMKNIVKEVIK